METPPLTNEESIARVFAIVKTLVIRQRALEQLLEVLLIQDDGSSEGPFVEKVSSKQFDDLFTQLRLDREFQLVGEALPQEKKPNENG